MEEASIVERPIAVVTGAAGGLGTAIVHRLRGRGMCVVAIDRTHAALVAAFEAEAPDLHFVCADVRDPESVSRAADDVATGLGDAWVLVNCAGVFARTPALETSPATVDHVIDTNLKGALHCTHAFVKHMARRSAGRIVHVSSIAAARGAALAGVYAASKAGLVALTQSHARELAPRGISVNAVLPGFCDTPMSAPERATLERFVVPRIPVGRLGHAEDVAEVVEFLAVCRTSYLTGAALTLDGGLHVG